MLPLHRKSCVVIARGAMASIILHSQCANVGNSVLVHTYLPSTSCHSSGLKIYLVVNLRNYLSEKSKKSK